MKKNVILYGNTDSGIQKKALEILTECLLDQTMEYPVCLPADTDADLTDCRLFCIGTRENNARLRARTDAPLTEPQQYRITAENDAVYIEGADEQGVLWGCVDFGNKYVLRFTYTHESGRYYRNIFEGTLPDYTLTASPSVRNRGIWTWGHVIYDWRGFLDSLVRLKMNTLTIWNDYPPVNARQIVEQAHQWGIRVIWGYAWFWDTRCDLIDIEKAYASGDEILAQYERDYRDLGGDGIYFQSFTELNRETIGGVLIAEAVTEFVNRTAAKFYEKYPDLELQFGLHANSVSQKLEYIRRVDPRIRIVWENCGAFPFAYIPREVDNFDATCDFVKKITHLRPGERFGAVTKGFTKLNWSEFEHPTGPMNIGVSSSRMQQNRMERKRPIWRYIQAHWLSHADYAYDMIRLLAEETGGAGDVSALVEDGMLETRIPYAVALYAEMLWDCGADLRTLMSDVALRDTAEFV